MLSVKIARFYVFSCTGSGAGDVDGTIRKRDGSCVGMSTTVVK